MSIFRPRAIPCPTCAAVEERYVALSVDAPRVPQVRRAILERTFQRFLCSACQGSFHVDAPLLYLDLGEPPSEGAAAAPPPARHWIAVHPRRWRSTWRALEPEVAEEFRATIADAERWLVEVAPTVRVRLVFGLEALREKLVCGAAGLDDALVEALKLDLAREHRLPLPSPDGDLPLVLDEAAGETLRFAAPAGPALVVPRARYDALAADRAAIAPTLEALAAGPFVDAARLTASLDAARSA